MQVLKSTNGVMRAICPNHAVSIRHKYANMLANMLPACEVLYIYVCGSIISIITDYIAATCLYDRTCSSRLYSVRRVQGGYLVCDIY